MKATVMKPVEIEIERVVVTLPVRYDDEDFPYDFPGRDGDDWRAAIMVGSGQILGWPEGKEAYMHMKVVDGGCYTLYAPNGERVGEIDRNYVPHGLIPGEYGDYVILDIGGDGVIKNWPENPSVDEFFSAAED